MQATVDGLTFYSDATTAATYTIESLTGWFEGVGVRFDRTPRPTADGVFDSPGYLDGRLISLQGLVLTSSEAAFAYRLSLFAPDPALYVP
jgi:hypothetical protein